MVDNTTPCNRGVKKYIRYPSVLDEEKRRNEKNLQPVQITRGEIIELLQILKGMSCRLKTVLDRIA